MDGSSACGFFDIILGLFVEAEVGTGKLVGESLSCLLADSNYLILFAYAVLDEAHKVRTQLSFVLSWLTLPSDSISPIRGAPLGLPNHYCPSSDNSDISTRV